MVGPPPSRWSVDASRRTAVLVAEGVWCLRLPLPWALIPHVNAYAVEQPDGGVMLVDCGGWGEESCWSALEGALRDVGIAPTDVRQLALTHYHTDHMGAAARLAEESGCEILGHARHEHLTNALLRPGAIVAARRRRATREGVPEQRLGAYASVREEVEGVLAPALPDRTLAAGDRVGGWTVLETPGHAPSHISLHRPADGVLIAGDLFGAAFTPYMDYGCSEDPLREYLDSLALVDELDATLALTGHGRPVTDPAAAIAVWREGLQSQCQAVLYALHAGPAGAYELACRARGRESMEDDRQGPSHLSDVLCHLRRLRASGRADRSTGADGRFLYSAR